MIILPQSISDSSTTIAVTPDPSLPQDSGLLQIEAEQITYTTLYMNTLYGCVRGANSTTPVAHDAGTPVAILDFFVAGSASDVTGIHADSNSDITGSVQLISGTNITLSQSGQAITVDSTTIGLVTNPFSDEVDANSHSIANLSGLSVNSGNGIALGSIDITSDTPNPGTLTFDSASLFVSHGGWQLSTSDDTSSGGQLVLSSAPNNAQLYGTAANSASLQVDDNSTANETQLLLWDITAATLQRVSIGDADSGGTGFRVLRIPN